MKYTMIWFVAWAVMSHSAVLANVSNMTQLTPVLIPLSNSIPYTQNVRPDVPPRIGQQTEIVGCPDITGDWMVTFTKVCVEGSPCTGPFEPSPYQFTQSETDFSAKSEPNPDFDRRRIIFVDGMIQSSHELSGKAFLPARKPESCGGALREDLAFTLAGHIINCAEMSIMLTGTVPTHREDCSPGPDLNASIEVIAECKEDASCICKGSSCPVTISQGVFQSDISLSDQENKWITHGDGRLDLVMNRETAILVKSTLLKNITAPAFMHLHLDSENSEPIVSIPFDPASIDLTEDIIVKFTPEFEGERTIVVKSEDANGVESNLASIDVNLIKTRDMIVPYLLVLPQILCSLQPNVCVDVEQNFLAHVRISNEFILDTYPLAQEGLPSRLSSFPIHVNRNSDDGIVQIRSDMNQIWKEAQDVDVNAERAVGVVPRGYFKSYDLCGSIIGANCTLETGEKPCASGARHLESGAVIAEERTWSTAAHELGHSFLGREEGYKFDNETCKSINENFVDGFWVKTGLKIKSVPDFMGTTPFDEELFTEIEDEPISRWVSVNHWEHLLIEFSTSKSDSPILYFMTTFRSDGAVELGEWRTAPHGRLMSPAPGPYILRVTDIGGATLFEKPFRISFMWQFHPFPPVELDTALVTHKIPYPITSATVSIIGPEGTILAEVDPVIKVLRDAVDAVPDQCFRENDFRKKQYHLGGISEVEQLLENGNIANAIQEIEANLQSKVEQDILVDCEVDNMLATRKEKLLNIIEDSLQRIKARTVTDVRH